MTRSIQNEWVGATLCAGEAGRTEVGFWRFAAEQYGIALDEEQWCELAELDDDVLIARRFFWRLSDPELHELLSAIPGDAG
jgi:hypothetical protein